MSRKGIETGGNNTKGGGLNDGNGVVEGTFEREERWKKLVCCFWFGNRKLGKFWDEVLVWIFLWISYFDMKKWYLVKGYIINPWDGLGIEVLQISQIINHFGNFTNTFIFQTFFKSSIGMIFFFFWLNSHFFLWILSPANCGIEMILNVFSPRHLLIQLNLFHWIVFIITLPRQQEGFLVWKFFQFFKFSISVIQRLFLLKDLEKIFFRPTITAFISEC